MSDANATGRWVTDAGDERVGSFTCCGEHLKTAHNIPSPFYEGQTRYYVYCPSCALAHFGVRPPGMETCGECGASPCDCEKPETWGFYWRAKGVELRTWASCSSRPVAVRARSECLRLSDGYDLGPVQRITEPPFDFDAAAKPPADCEYLMCGHPGGCPIHSPGEAAPKPSAKCSLDWCSAPTHSTFCSSNCERAHEDRIAAVARREAWRAGVPGEAAWAVAKADEEIAAVKARWGAMRTERPVGDASVFPLLKEEETSW